MIPAILVGAGTGVGLWLIVTWAFPARPALGARLAAAFAPPATDQITITADAGWVTTLGRLFIPGLRSLGLPDEKVERDLRVLGRGIGTHLAAKAVFTLIGLLAPLLLHVLLAVAGVSVALELSVAAAGGLTVGGFLLPDVEVRSRAARARTEFRTALSAFLDLVWITLAGGAGIEAALIDAAEVGQGPAFTQLRRALDAAQLTRATPWSTLRQLGDELDITELSELAASISLAGTEGAKVRASLAAKAQALRTHQLTDAEAEAQAATERMALPVTLLFLGFLGFIAYPAVNQVLNGL